MPFYTTCSLWRHQLAVWFKIMGICIAARQSNTKLQTNLPGTFWLGIGVWFEACHALATIRATIRANSWFNATRKSFEAMYLKLPWSPSWFKLEQFWVFQLFLIVCPIFMPVRETVSVTCLNPPTVFDTRLRRRGPAYIKSGAGSERGGRKGKRPEQGVESESR